MSDIIVETRHELKFIICMKDVIIPAGTQCRIIDVQIDEDTTTMFLCEFNREDVGIEWLTSQDIISLR